MVYPLSAKNSPSTMLAIILLSRKNRLFLLLSATRPDFWSPNKKHQTFEVQRRLIAYLCKNILFSQPCKVALYRSKVTNWWLAFETLPKLAFWILSKRFNCFYPSSAFLSIWNRFRPVLQGEPLKQVRIPTALPAVSFVLVVRLIEGLFCVHV